MIKTLAVLALGALTGAGVALLTAPAPAPVRPAEPAPDTRTPEEIAEALPAAVQLAAARIVLRTRRAQEGA